MEADGILYRRFTMRLASSERERLRELLKDCIESREALRMKKYVQHGTISTYDHCRNVVRVSYWLSRRLRIRVDERALARGAFLHDFYLYDWHDKDPSHRLHGFSHPGQACATARRYFKIGKKEAEIIRCHMWPLTLRHMPRSREALIVCAADKYCSLLETFLGRGGKGVRICG